MNNGSESQVAILAGGLGTRLRSRLGDLPKPMVPVLGKPLLQHQIELCREHGFVDIILLLHHRPEAVMNYFGDGAKFGVRFDYEIEQVPRGTAGALRDVVARLAPRFLVLYGDTFVDVDLRKLWQTHVSRRADATLFLHPNDHPQDSDLIALGNDGFVEDVVPYPHPSNHPHRNLVNAALYVIERKALESYLSPEGPADIAKQMFPALLKSGHRLFGHVTPEYIKDIGTPQRLDKVESDINSGMVERLSERVLRSAVFLDRDGTINREVGHLRRPDQIELLEGASDAIRKINRSGRLAVVVTNQPVVARGDVTLGELETIHARLESLLGEAGAYLDRFYVCPHHPDSGFPGEITALKIDCLCRKPRTGLFDIARRELNVDSAQSWFVGDTTSDMEAGRRAGLRTILVRTGHAGADDKFASQPDYVVPDLASATQWILERHSEMSLRLSAIAAICAANVRIVLVGGLARSGKSAVAQVLKELLRTMGIAAHAVSLDAWLRPAELRIEGDGVLARYDMSAAAETLQRIANSPARLTISTPVYDRKNRTMHRNQVRHSIGPDDVIIVEGVPALMSSQLRELGQLKVYIDVPENERLHRLRADYAWRNLSPVAVDELLRSRALDEHHDVIASKESAHHVVFAGSTE